ncbi:MAG: hypothetical protein PUC29_00090 [Clostridia bacterium]|nr:hypothetical protein [Clostridia bacterium]
MKINKKQMEMLTSLPDDALRKIIRSLGSSSGFDLSGMEITSSELDRLRAVLREMDESDIDRAAQILKNSKNK